MISLGERLRHQDRKGDGGVAVDLDGPGRALDLAPRNRLVRPRARVRAVELLGRVDKDGKVRAIPLKI